MSFEESVLLRLMTAVNSVRLDAIIVGNAAAALHGVPVTTQDIDLFVRDTPQNMEKIQQLLSNLGVPAHASRPFEPVSRMIRIEGLPVDIDFVFELSSREKFEAVRARSCLRTIEGVSMRLAAMNDVISAKRAAGRPKDLAVLPLLEQFVRVKSELERGDPGS